MASAQTRSREIQLFEPAQNALHTRKCRAAHFANQSPFFISTTTEAMPSTSTKSEPEHAYKEMYSKSRRSALPPKTEAPDFILRSTPDQWLSLSEFRGQPVCWRFTRQIGGRSVEIRWLSTTKC
jgi:hypothetical protein